MPKFQQNQENLELISHFRVFPKLLHQILGSLGIAQGLYGHCPGVLWALPKGLSAHRPEALWVLPRRSVGIAQGLSGHCPKGSLGIAQGLTGHQILLRLSS